MFLSWLYDKLFKSSKVLTIDLSTMSPTTPMSYRWHSSISALEDEDYDGSGESQIALTTPISMTIAPDIHHFFHHYTNLTQMWSSFAMELMQKNQHNFWLMLLFCLIFLCISIVVIFILIKLLNYCSLKSQSFSVLFLFKQKIYFRSLLWLIRKSPSIEQ